MKKKFYLVMTLAAMILTFFLITSPAGTVFAEIADGSYQVNYEMKEKSSDSTSIADGYFTSPATLTVKDGVKHIQLTLTGSDMIKSLSAPSGPVSVVSEGDNTRVVKFKVDDLSKPLNMEMHIVVPDMYDTTHTARAVFDVSSLPEAGSGGSEGASVNKEGSSNTDNGAGTPVDNPPTGDETPIALYVTLLLASVAIFTVYKLRAARN